MTVYYSNAMQPVFRESKKNSRHHTGCPEKNVLLLLQLELLHL